MQLDTINTLYLELSQVATATTAKELALKKELAAIIARAEAAEERVAELERVKNRERIDGQSL